MSCMITWVSEEQQFHIENREVNALLVEAGPVQRIIIRIRLVEVYFMLSCMNMDSAKI